MSDELTQVYVVTNGRYSDYGIASIWLTLEEARTACGDGDDDGYGSRVEVWPIGEHQRTLGNFSHSGDYNAKTGELINGWDNEGPSLTEDRSVVCCWEGKDRIGIRVTADTQERADKVYSEVRARVLADISLGLPADVIADQIYVNHQWRPTKATQT